MPLQVSSLKAHWAACCSSDTAASSMTWQVISAVQHRLSTRLTVMRNNRTDITYACSHMPLFEVVQSATECNYHIKYLSRSRQSPAREPGPSIMLAIPVGMQLPTSDSCTAAIIWPDSCHCLNQDMIWQPVEGSQDDNAVVGGLWMHCTALHRQ